MTRSQTCCRTHIKALRLHSQAIWHAAGFKSHQLTIARLSGNLAEDCAAESAPFSSCRPSFGCRHPECWRSSREARRRRSIPAVSAARPPLSRRTSAGVLPARGHQQHQALATSCLCAPSVTQWHNPSDTMSCGRNLSSTACQGAESCQAASGGGRGQTCI